MNEMKKMVWRLYVDGKCVGTASCPAAKHDLMMLMGEYFAAGYTADQCDMVREPYETGLEEVEEVEETTGNTDNDMKEYLVTVTYNSGNWTSELDSYMSVFHDSMKEAKEYAANRVKRMGYHVVKVSAHKVKPGEYVEDYWYRWLYNELVYGEV